MIPQPPIQPRGDRNHSEHVAEGLEAVVPTCSPRLPVSGEPSQPRWYARWVYGVLAGTEWVFGLGCLIVGLSLLATIPLLQVLSLGYLLEVSGRLARTGKLSAGFVGVRKAAKIGGLLLGTWLVFLPVRAVSGLWYSSLLLNGATGVTRAWRIGLVLVAIMTVAHVTWAWYRGGRLWHFAWPAPRQLVKRIRQGAIVQEGVERFWNFVAQLRFSHYFQLGLRAGLAAFVWLAIPVTMMVLAARLPVPVGAIFGLLGGLLLAIVVMYLPFMQARFGASNRGRDLFDVRTVRRDFTRAPIAFWISLCAVVALALPLYLLKAELLPREAEWLPSIVFVVFTLPARWLCGWAIARAHRRTAPRHFIFRWASRTALIPVVLIYVTVVYLTRYISWYGGWSLYEQHAFLLPVPFLSL